MSLLVCLGFFFFFLLGWVEGKIKEKYMKYMKVPFLL